ncbi:MarR family winged helix-turn-helix transcriptional regulator [Streptomyces sp. NPDC096311]|uniref:MarR family winged helix-turn-helix transcriptional regulator n=1 Tax=Streptomyces sp. NPDC096311 TaxID=3366083 RepID=UPI00381BC02E
MPDGLAGIERELMVLGRHQAAAALRVLAPERLDRSAYIMLCRIEAEGPMSIGQLAAALGLEVSTVNRQTAAMLRNGLVKRIPDPEGGLARKLRITNQGLKRVRAHRAWTLDSLAQILADWPEEATAELARLLARFNLSIERVEDRPWPRHELV